MDSKKIKEQMLRLLVARMKILIKNPFYGLLLMNVNLGLDVEAETAYACGNKICFSPKFLDELSDEEVDFVLHHEILHIVLKHCYRYVVKNEDEYELFNIAADLVVDSTIFVSSDCDESKITVDGRVRYHLVPNGKEASDYTVEQVFLMLQERRERVMGNKGFKDDHTKWQKVESAETLAEIDKIIISSIQAAKNLQKNGGLQGNYVISGLPEFAERLYKELTEPKLDWRLILNNFIQEETNDYSFSPPDRRYQGDFYLPDFNDTEQTVKNILFVIDTSGSMSEEDVTEMYSEIYGAISQFNGRLQGYLGFFDAAITEPKPFNDIEEFKCITAVGGGGTNFYCIFKYVFEKMQDNLPTAIIILTDGYAPFPKEEIARGIPVLWVLNNNIVKPPFGKVLVINDK